MTGVAGISGYQDDCVIFSIVWCKWKKGVYIAYVEEVMPLKQDNLYYSNIYICIFVGVFLILTSVIMYS